MIDNDSLGKTTAISPGSSHTGRRPLIPFTAPVHRAQAQLPFLVFMLAHLALGLLLREFSALGTFHAYGTILLGVTWALLKPPIHTAFMAAYIVGAEVVWRMTAANIPWESGKYSIILLMGIALIQHRKTLIPVAPLFYFLLLLPSALLTLNAVNLSTARDQISFNLSGPLALFVSVTFFSSMKVNRGQLTVLLIALVAPIITIAAYALSSTFSGVQIRWVNDSMFVTSGGYGPNQVSTIMGLGLLSVWIILTIGKLPAFAKWSLAVVGIAFFVQGLLTFSRGGMLAAVVSIAFVTIHFLSDTKHTLKSLFLAFTVLLVAAFFLFPSLNEFTDGFLEQRFSNTNLTHRDVLIEEELLLFEQNPIVGVGPGMGNFLLGAAAHTELTRLLAEHGALGLLSLLILLFMALGRYIRTRQVILRGLYGTWILWSILVMTNAAMRLAAVSFVFGLAFMQIDLDE